MDLRRQKIENIKSHLLNDGGCLGFFDIYCKQYIITHEKNPFKILHLNGLAK